MNGIRKKTFISQQEISAYEALFGKNSAQDNDVTTPLFTPEEQSLTVSQIHNSYIVYQSADGLYIIDQHNAHVRILYDKAIQSLTIEKNTQELLFPVTVPLTTTEKNACRRII